MSRARVGRKTKFTTETREKIIKLVRKGLPLHRAANGAGVSNALFFRWKKQALELISKLDNEEIDESELTDFELELIEFIEKIDNAVAEWLEEKLDQLTNANDAKWLLTKRLPDYKDVSTVKADVQVKAKVTWKDFVNDAKQEE